MKRLISIFMAARFYFIVGPVAFCVAGSVANQSVIVANHGAFPVMLSTASLDKADANGFLDKEHCLMTDKTNLNWLADWITLFHGDKISSPGDILGQLGLFLLPYTAVIWVTLLVNDRCSQGVAAPISGRGSRSLGSTPPSSAHPG